MKVRRTMPRQRRSWHLFPLVIACLLGFALGGRYGSPIIDWKRDWNIAAPPEQIFARLNDVGAYGTWWRGLETQSLGTERSAKVKAKPDHLPSVSFGITRVTAISPVVLRFDVSGNLVGSIDMILSAQGGVTRVSIYPLVRPINPLYNFAGLILYPLAKEAYDELMKSGEEGLRWKVGAR